MKVPRTSKASAVGVDWRWVAAAEQRDVEGRTHRRAADNI